MESLKRLLALLLDPRARLKDMPGISISGSEPGQEEEPQPRRRLGWRMVVFNSPLVFGGLILIVLFLMVLFGPLVAPVNPYIASQHIVPHFDSQQGVWISPPLEPSEVYPLGTDEWGNDIYSMLLYGARNTLVASLFIAVARVLLGLVFGGLAGWNEGKTVDQLIMALVGVLTAVPLLVSSMILIFALDIRRGLPVFIAALSALGWTEIAQYIRSEFLVLRKMPYIEGARAVGARNLAISVRHILPNLLPQLLVITFLEIGAVLMLLGELGFVGVYIGGGSHIAMGDELTGIQVVTLSEVPEWGAMLAEGYRWLRAKPFIVFPPAFAFFIAVVGFNTFGEGLRRLLEQSAVSTAFLLRKRMLLVFAGLTAATVFIINNTGPAPWFTRMARAYSGETAYEHVQALTQMQGRGAGQPGGNQAAAYIAEKFQSYGLDPGWRQNSYLYPLPAVLVRPLEQPVLALLDAQGNIAHSFRHQVDFSYVIEGHGGSGHVEQTLVYVGFDPEKHSFERQDFKGLDLRERIVLLVQGNAPPGFASEALIRGAKAVLWVVDQQPQALRSQVQLADPDGEYLSRPTLPIFRLTSQAADRILEQAGLSVAGLISESAQVGESETGWHTHPLDVTVRMTLSLQDPQQVEIPCVLGFVPGSDYGLANEMVVLFARYDGMGMEADGSIFPSANHNASGVSTLLEIARLWQQQNLDARRSVLFVAWGAGQLDDPGAVDFLVSRESIRHLPNPNQNRPLSAAVVFQLEGTGAGGDVLYAYPNSSPRLTQLLAEVAGEQDIQMVTSTTSPAVGELLFLSRAAWIGLGWHEIVLSPQQDVIERIDPVKLQRLGEILSLALTRIVRQTAY